MVKGRRLRAKTTISAGTVVSYHWSPAADVSLCASPRIDDHQTRRNLLVASAEFSDYSAHHDLLWPPLPIRRAAPPIKVSAKTFVFTGN